MTNNQNTDNHTCILALAYLTFDLVATERGDRLNGTVRFLFCLDRYYAHYYYEKD